MHINNADFDIFFASDGARIYDITEKTVAENDMQRYIESGVVVGLSGGADSVMLLLFLLEYRRRNGLDFSIVACHINHGIRGEEADRDEEFSCRICEELGVEIVVERYPIPLLAERYKCSIEEAARFVRYRCFEKIILGREDIGCIAVAHNMSDNAETVVFNILRGSGAKGASGIKPIRDNIIRPLIRVSKKDIQSAMDTFGLAYVTDSTNEQTDYTRNYIRHEIIPAFERITSDPEMMITRFSDNMRCDEDFISGLVKDFISSHQVVRNSDLASVHYAMFVRIIAQLADRAGASVSYRIAEDIHKLLSKDNFSYSLIGKATFVCERGECTVQRDTTEGEAFCFTVEEGVTDLAPMNAVFMISPERIDKSFTIVYKNSIQANLSSAIINGSLYLRPKKDGDTVYYGGMTHKIKKLFSDSKIPRSKRGLIPILCDDSGVLWVPGFGVRDDGVPVSERKDLFVTLCIKDDSATDGERLYSASEFRTKT